MDQEFVRPSELAKRFNMSKAQIRELAVKGQIPCYRLGSRAVRFKITEVEEWLATRKGFEFEKEEVVIWVRHYTR